MGQENWAQYSDTSSKRMPRSFSARIRQAHRWIAICFVSTVVANFAAMAFGEPPAWITYAPLLPLFLLMFSGAYLFVLPYLSSRAR